MRNLDLLARVNAVSEPEKNAESSRRKKRRPIARGIEMPAMSMFIE